MDSRCKLLFVSGIGNAQRTIPHAEIPAVSKTNRKNSSATSIATISRNVRCWGRPPWSSLAPKKNGPIWNGELPGSSGYVTFFGCFYSWPLKRGEHVTSILGYQRVTWKKLVVFFSPVSPVELWRPYLLTGRLGPLQSVNWLITAV